MCQNCACWKVKLQRASTDEKISRRSFSKEDAAAFVRLLELTKRMKVRVARFKSADKKGEGNSCEHDRWCHTERR
jgi:hypothetical protein